MKVDQAALHDFVSAEVERQVADRLHDSNETAVEETFMDAFQLETGSVVLQKKSTFNGFVDSLISGMKKSGQFDSDLETSLRNVADSTTFMDSIVSRIMTQESLITPVAQFAKNSASYQAQVMTVQACFQEAFVHRTKTIK